MSRPNSSSFLSGLIFQKFSQTSKERVPSQRARTMGWPGLRFMQSIAAGKFLRKLRQFDYGFSADNFNADTAGTARNRHLRGSLPSLKALVIGRL